MKSPVSHPSCYHLGYSLSCDEFDSLLKRAGGKCELCRQQVDSLQIDHDHALGGAWAVRGLLCGLCNQRIRRIESGGWVPTSEDRAYLASAWHLTQTSSAAKAARVRPRRPCPTCGHDSAVKTSGGLHLHWSRLPGKSDERCPADAPSS